jgi:hypothetical protein
MAKENTQKQQSPETSVNPSPVPDPGALVIEHLYAAMNIDAAWSTRAERGFTWWGTELAQTITWTPMESVTGPYSRVEIATALVDRVKASDKVFEILNVLNRLAHVAPLVWTGSGVVFRNVFDVTHLNLEAVKQLALVCAGLQVSDAEMKAQHLAEALGGFAAVSNHPTNGCRPEPDELVNLLQTFFIPRGQGESPFDASRFHALRVFDWLEANASPTGFAGTFWCPHRENAPAVFRATTEERHPLLGGGVLVRITVPVKTTPIDAAAMNLADQLFGVPQLGAWVSGKETNFVAFIPAAAVTSSALEWLAGTAFSRVDKVSIRGTSEASTPVPCSDDDDDDLLVPESATTATRHASPAAQYLITKERYRSKGGQTRLIAEWEIANWCNTSSCTLLLIKRKRDYIVTFKLRGEYPADVMLAKMPKRIAEDRTQLLMVLTEVFRRNGASDEGVYFAGAAPTSVCPGSVVTTDELRELFRANEWISGDLRNFDGWWANRMQENE